jgi:hypothetical protein
MTPRDASPIQAERTLRDYRAAHRIIAIRAPKEETLGGYVCDFDDIPVYQIKGGWRHEHSEIRVLAEQAPIRFPGEAR